MFLKCSNVSKSFGGLNALNGINLAIEREEIVGLIGANGAGKTTFFNVISGYFKNSFSGAVEFKNVLLNKFSPHKICRMGIARTFQVVKPFNDFTVCENVSIGLLFGNHRYRNLSEAKDKASELLEFSGLAEKMEHKARELTLADRKRLEITRAIATSPELLLLDEMLSGLNPSEINEAIRLIFRIRNTMNITIFLIEHVMKAVMEICDKIVVLDYGMKIAEGTASEVSTNENVIKAYLGKGICEKG